MVSDTTLSSFDVEEIPIETLLFQTGYLTIKEVTTIGTQYAYILTYPNLEVKASLNGALAEIATNTQTRNRTMGRLSKLLAKGDLTQLQAVLFSHFAANSA